MDEWTVTLWLGALVAVVAAFAWMPKPRWLDRVWLWLVAFSVPLGGLPILLRLSDQHGALNVSLGVLALFLAGMYRAWPTE